jgi:prevent-host-death family protein
MLSKLNTWKLQDAKARFSELVRRARDGEPQRVTVHGKEAVIVVDPARFDVTPKPAAPRTMREFVEASKKYRLDIDFDFDEPLYMEFPEPPIHSKGETEK